MARSAVKATRWSRTTLGFAADLALYLVIALSLWLVVPMLILGWTPVLITSGSMSPAVEPGDVLLVERGVPEGEWFVPGTIITYETAPTLAASGGAEASGPGRTAADEPRLVTHRVDRIDAEGNYITRGDANGSTDVDPVAADQVVGAARLLVPSIGLPVHWARDGRLLQLALVAFALMGTIFASRLDAQTHERPATQDGRGDRELEGQSVRRDRTRTDPARPERRYPTREVADPATLAARAARAARAGSGAGVARLPDRPRDDEVADAREPRRRSGGLPPAGAVLGILALGMGVLMPTAEAAFLDASTNEGSRFSTAAASDVEVAVEITNEWGSGYCADALVSTTSTTPVTWEVEVDLSSFPLNGNVNQVWEADWTLVEAILTATGAGYNDTVVVDDPVTWGFCASRPPGSIPTVPLELPLHGGEAIVSGGVGNGTTIVFEVPVDHALYLAGQAHAGFLIRRTPGLAGNSPGSLEVTLSADGEELASGGVWSITNTSWHAVEAPLFPAIIETFDAGTTFVIEVNLNRIELEVGGPSVIELSGG